MPKNVRQSLRGRLRAYWTLIKSLQALLLLITGLAGYLSARCPVTTLPALLALAGSLFLSISGSTVLNMYFDRDIDARMGRTCQRPLPAGLVAPWEALTLGLILSVAGVAWACLVTPLYGTVIAAGVFFDVVVYTMWLKRRTPYSIVIGGVAGGMPALAGRALGVGRIDIVGLLLALAVLLWIPTHIVTFSMRYHEDYQRGGIPIFPTIYGFGVARGIIASSTAAASVAMLAVAVAIGMARAHLGLLAALSAGLLAVAVVSMARPSQRADLILFKSASLYMLGSMVFIVAATV
ncbi:MAG TPA: protoheme IX farnesyltransferase [Anaerolineae bacterium]|nr:protoheme IX farnesyltransferase [Anaerolineae bacterium]HPL27210.1 protoheme IX farnesyltransferase [Anaerolineae bacterium]